MSLFDLQDVCIAIGSIATLDLPMVVDLIGIYGLKGPYRTLTTTNWFMQALSVIPRDHVAMLLDALTMIRWANHESIFCRILLGVLADYRLSDRVRAGVAVIKSFSGILPEQGRRGDVGVYVGDPDPPPGQAAEEQKLEYREAINTIKNNSTCINIHRVFQACYLAGTCAWLQPVFQEPGASRLIAVVTSIRSTTRSETPSSDCTRSPDEISTIGFSTTCVTLNGSGIQLAVGPQPLRLRNHNSGLVHRIMVKRLATSPHDPLGITDSACKNQLVVVSVQYGPFNPYIPIRSTTIGKSRIAIDPIAMHTSWRSNSDIASVTSIGYPRMSASGESSTTMHRLLHASRSHPIPTPYDPKTNQYNQDLGLIHSTNGNHLESPKERSSIDHQPLILSILSVDCVEWLAAGCPVVGREMLATGFIALKLACDCAVVLQSLAKHAIHQMLAPAGHCHRKIFLLILIANAKRCRSNLFKRHRFAIANFKYHLLVDISYLLIPSSLSAPTELSSSADCDVVTNDIIIDASADCTVACDWFVSSTTSLPLASECKLPADSCDWSLKPSAEYDDVTYDVISTNPSAESQHDVASSLALRFIFC
ncbi:dentin sialophosphoprotein-like [Dorcoceras hygrometricum]|uniref:Dentin sialophosphoprotein-like n=1 Tax=Dorcoceras hygrometricum TaxID=472368 RepID=A0A2Z7CLI0_9LAMI|nr:dentin sialophosphoprotein-like [Dorcoceras hygrometricum]